MKEKIEHLLRRNTWETEDAQQEVVKYLKSIQEYTAKALEKAAGGDTWNEVDWIENHVGHLRKAQDKLNQLGNERVKLNWLLKEAEGGGKA